MLRAGEDDGTHVSEGEGLPLEEFTAHVIEGRLDDAVVENPVILEAQSDDIQVTLLGYARSLKVQMMKIHHLFAT